MEHIKNFLRGKGFALALLACILAAAAVGIWAVRTVRSQLEEQLRQVEPEISGQETEPDDYGMEYGGLEEYKDLEGEAWRQESTGAAGSIQGVPETASGSSGELSGVPSGSASVSEPSELQTALPDASVSAASSCVRPVPGRMLAGYSGDELVFSETLGDWRTHNGVDYACDAGAEVLAPVSGKVVGAANDGNWGTVIAIQDAEGRQWRLCGIADAAVAEGDEVSAGQRIGSAGGIACESALGSHIHLEVMDEDKYLDPARLLG